MTDQTLDRLARRIILDAARQEWGSFAAELPEHGFSPEFEKKMRRLVRRANHPVRCRMIQTAACFMLAALLSGCAVLAVSQDARAAFAGWIRELQQEWFSYRYAGEVDSSPRNTVYYPAWLPEGYREVEAPAPGTFVRALYQHESGALLSFAYQVGLEKTAFHVEWENTNIQPVTVSGKKADFYQNTPGGANVLVWTDEAQGIVFWLAAQLTEEELIQAAESLRESEPLDWVYRPTWLPGPVALVSSVEADGEGNTVYETGEGDLITFCYSKSGRTPYTGQTGGQSIVLESGTAMLYPVEEGGMDSVLTWADNETGYALWLISRMPEEELIQFAESVRIYSHNINSTLESESFSDEVIIGPPCEKVRQALTEEFAANVKAYAERDAAVNIYMQEDYHEMERDYMRSQISPQREPAMERVSNLMNQYAGADRPPGNHVLCLIEPFYFASITASDGYAAAHIYDVYGRMIASYNSYNSDGGPWTDIWTLEELQFSYQANQIYAAAYREARAGLADPK